MSEIQNRRQRAARDSRAAMAGTDPSVVDQQQAPTTTVARWALWQQEQREKATAEGHVFTADTTPPPVSSQQAAGQSTSAAAQQGVEGHSGAGERPMAASTDASRWAPERGETYRQRAAREAAAAMDMSRASNNPNLPRY